MTAHAASRRELATIRALPARTGPGGIVRASEPVTITSLPQVVHLELYQGDDFVLRLDVYDPDGLPLDLTGAAVLSQIRESPESNIVRAVFTPTIAGNTLYLHLPAVLSAVVARRAVWDAQITHQNRVTTLAGGRVIMHPQVSR